MHSGVLDRSNRAEVKISEMAVKPDFQKRTDFVAARAPALKPAGQRLPPRVITIVASEHAPVDVETLIPVSSVGPRVRC